MGVNGMVPSVAALAVLLAWPAAADDIVLEMGEVKKVKGEPTETVFVFKSTGGKLISRPVAREQAAQECPKCLKVATKEGLTLLFDSIRTYNRFLVDDCSKRARAGVRLRFIMPKPYACYSYKGVMSPGRAAYDIEMTKNGVRVGLSVRYVIPKGVGGDRARRLWQDTFNAGAGSFISVLGRYGIHVDYENPVTYAGSSTEGDPPLSHPETRIELTDDAGRANIDKYHFRGQNFHCLLCQAAPTEYCRQRCPTEVTDDFSETVAHETAHLLGLPDEYPSSGCPSRTLAAERNPESLMDQRQGRGLDNMELFPRHIAAFVGPLCAGTRAIIAGGALPAEYARPESFP